MQPSGTGIAAVVRNQGCGQTTQGGNDRTCLPGEKNESGKATGRKRKELTLMV